MKDSNKTPKLESRDVAAASPGANTTELSLEDLSKVSAGQTCVGTSYKTVGLGMRKSGGDSSSGSF